MTRLLDRMECRGLIVRQRCELDRRVVHAKVSQKGLELLERADPLMHELHFRQFERFSEAQLGQIKELMERVLTG